MNIPSDDRAGEKDGWNYKSIVYHAAVLISAIVLLVTGFVIDHVQKRQVEGAAGDFGWHLASHLVTEIGIACFIAFLLSVTIEHLSQQEFHRLASRHQDLIKENVFHYVYGQSLPQPVVGEIESQLLRSVFVRKNMKVRHRISSFAPDPKYVVVTTNLEYEVENITQTEQTFTCRIMTDDSPDQAFLKECNISGMSFHVAGAAPDILDIETIQKWCSHEKVGLHILFEKEYKIPPRGSAKCSAHLRALKLYDIDYEIFTNNDPVCGFEIHVAVDADLQLDLFSHSFHPSEFVLGGGHFPQNKQYHWLILRPVLRCQGGFVMWKRNKSPKGDGAKASIPAHVNQSEVVVPEAEKSSQ